MVFLVNSGIDAALGAGDAPVCGKKAAPVRIVAFGDSLTAGYGLPGGAGFPARLEQALAREGIEATVINAGRSGDTTAGGLARLGWVLVQDPYIVIVELGANDALRGLDPRHVEGNLDAVLTGLAERGVKVLFTGMRAPLNMGEEYAQGFNAVFPRLASRHGVSYYPFFLEGVAGRPELNQADGIHPNERGVEEIVRRILPVLKALVGDVCEGRRPR